VNPRTLYRTVAIAEAVTWALLLTGMFLKYVTVFRDGSSLASSTTGVGELAVSVFGMVHGVVFIAYCLVTALLFVDQKWPVSRLALGLGAAVPPFATVPFERYAERAGLLGDAWRLRSAAPHGLLERLTAWLVRRPAQGALVGLVAVVGLTGVALVVGPPV
jgi:integral membrane protein